MADLQYVLSFKGAASPTLRSAFANCDIEADDGVTVVRCPHDDLSRVITQIQDLGLELLDVHLVADSDEVQ
ncbi:MAG TPA: hypothetical protein VHQ23_19545 [Ilumatobacteraceae bacterium]|jgi:hypothetical protein|nr:hypothetical protein [Ilumatobacteraceae bacterium]